MEGERKSKGERGQGTGRWHTRGGMVVGGDRRISSYDGECRYAREDKEKDVDVQLKRFMYISRGTSREDREGRVQGGDRGGVAQWRIASRLHQWRMGGLGSRSRRRGQRRRRWWRAGARASTDGRRIRDPSLASGWRGRSRKSERRVERRVELPPPPVEAAVETVSAAEVLAGVAEYGPNYSLPQPAESKTARRKRLRLD